MGRIFKRTAVLTMVLGMIGLLMSCGSGMKEKPEMVVTDFFEAAKRTDLVAMKSYLSQAGKMTKFDSPQQEKVLKSMMEKLKYEIVSAKIADDTATVRAKVVSADLLKIAEDVSRELLPDIMERVANGERDIGSKGVEYIFNSFAQRLSKADMPTISKEIDIKLKADKAEKVWEIVPDEELLNAITGNAAEAFSEMNR